MAASQFFRYDDPLSVYPTSIHPSGKGEQIAVLIRDGTQHYAKGGLAAKAETVRKAGRGADDYLVHMNAEELKQMSEMWGEPTINPETGQPEFLFGFLKKALGFLAPLVSFIPGVGPLAAAAIGAGAGAVNGGIKGALGGALGGAAGAGGFGGAGSLGNIAASTAAGGIQGGLQGALMGGAGSAASGALAPKTANSLATSAGKTGTAGASVAKTPAIPSSATNPRLEAISGGSTFVNPNSLTPSPKGVVGDASRISLPQPSPNYMVGSSPAANPLSESRPYGQAAGPLDPGLQPGALDGGAPGQKKSWFSRDFLGIKGLPNWAGIPLTGLAIASLIKGNPDESGGIDAGMNADQLIGAKLQPTFRQSSLPSPSGFYGNLAARSGAGSQINQAEQRAYGSGPEGRFFNYAKGGRTSFAVKGAGTGRSDEIPAMLSDGEYVIDADTVAMLGDGSTKAGADALDKLRVNIRKHKGRNMARGRMGAKAKAPEHYLRGGRA